jgi:hypothetical protein
MGKGFMVSHKMFGFTGLSFRLAVKQADLSQVIGFSSLVSLLLIKLNFS